MGKTREKDKLDEVLDELLKDCKSSEDIVGKNGLLKDLSKRLFERALQGEMTATWVMSLTPMKAVTQAIVGMVLQRRPWRPKPEKSR